MLSSLFHHAVYLRLSSKISQPITCVSETQLPANSVYSQNVESQEGNIDVSCAGCFALH